MNEATAAVREAPQTKETPIANVSANLFRAAYVCASREETRYYLNGVHITPHPDGGALLIATDGHRMIIIRDDSAWCRESRIVQVDKIGLDACKPPPKRSSKPIVGAGKVVDSLKESKERRLIVQHDGMAEIDGVWRSPGKVLIDGTFPDWRRVCPFSAKWEQKPASFNSKYLGEFGQIAAILRGSSEPSIALKIITDGPGDPALIHMGDITNAFGILMPMRGAERSGFPVWMAPIQQAVETEKAKALAAEAEEAKKKAVEAAKVVAAAQPAKAEPAKPTRREKAKRPKAKGAKAKRAKVHKRRR